MKILGVIPSRYQSSRFPGKPLVDIDGVSMIRRVYQQCLKSKFLNEVVVATDDIRIAEEVKSFGGKFVMTSEACPNGTARCKEVLAQMDVSFDFIINIQGDEPFIHPEQIDELASVLEENTELGTLVKVIEDAETLFNQNTPKVVLNENNEALYFSRNTVPFIRDVEKQDWLKHHTYYKHIGIYAYRSDVLNAIVDLPEGVLESVEKLEQLRWLEHAYRINVAVTAYDSHGIDTPEDIERVLKLVRA